MNISRFTMQRLVTKDNTFIELVLNPEGSLCFYNQVQELEAINAELLDALQDAIALYGKFGAIVNDPHNAGEWITKAQEAVRRATE